MQQIEAGAFTYHDYGAERSRAELAAVRDPYLAACDEFARRADEVSP